MFNRQCMTVLLIAVTYFVLGKLALLLAIPPGYATAIWPAAGVALAALLLKGYRFWPGVLLGSFLVNLNTSPDLSLPPLQLLAELTVPFVIASGAALQAVFGAWLVRRYVGYPIGLDNVGQALRFIVFACGVGSVISASIGTATLLAAGLLAAENVVFNWLTWWAGDGLGVMIFTILMFVYFGAPREVWHSRRRILPMILVSACVVVVFLYVIGSRWELSRQQDEFRRYSGQIFHRAQAIIDTHIESLYAIGALFEVSDNVTAVEFEAFVDGVLERNTGFQALVWAQRVSGLERLAVEEQMSLERGVPVHITRRDHQRQLVLQQSQQDYVVIRYIEPIVSNVGALAYDISSADVVRRALMRAAMSDKPATTGPISLVQEQEGQLGLVVYLPVRSVASAGGGSMLLGYVAAVFRIPDLLDLLLAPEYLGDISASVSLAGDGTVLYSKSPASTKRSLFSDSAVLNFADTEWRFELNADQRFLVDSRSMVPWAMLVAGLLFSGLLGMTFLVLTGQRHSAEMARKKLKDMLVQLQEAQEHLIESEKMASLGGLVAGFAHELNTPLGIAITAESTLQDDLAKLSAAIADSEVSSSTADTLRRMQEASRIVLANVQRAGALIMSFKQVSVDQATVETRTINVHNYLSDVLVHLSPNYRRSGHQIALECPVDLNIRTVPGGLAQTVINLLNNSLVHAFPNEQKGRITLQVSQRRAELVLRVSDDGIGIPLTDQKKIFEPFYTTRRGSGGTGLGLHVVYNIVKRQLKGRISVSSEPGEGACFEIVLPLSINELSGEVS